MTLKFGRTGTASVLCLVLFAHHASATTIPSPQIVVEATLLQTGPLNDAQLGIDWSLNGQSIPVQNQTLQLGLGEAFEARVTGMGSSSVTGPGEVFGSVSIDALLAPGVDASLVRNVLTATVNTAGTDAFAVAGFQYNCAALQLCSLPLDPGAPEIETRQIVSDLLFGNVLLIGGMTMPTGRNGGLESLRVEKTFRLAREAQSTQNPVAQFAALFDLAAIESTATVDMTWQVTVVPVPAAAWLFVSALGLLASLTRVARA